VHLSNVQPCNNVLNQPLAEMDEDGLWSEVTVPLTEVRATANPTASVRHIVYYGCNFSRGEGQRWLALVFDRRRQRRQLRPGLRAGGAPTPVGAGGLRADFARPTAGAQAHRGRSKGPDRHCV